MSKRPAGTVERLVRLAIVLSMLGAVVAALVLPLGVKDASKVTTFLGRFHILALHVPIGVLVLALTGEALTLLRRGRRTGDVVVGVALPMLVITGFAAIVLGAMLAHGGHYPHRLVAPHRNLTILGILFAGVARLLWTRRRSRWLHRGLLGASALAMTVGAHFGGSITHGADYLTAPVEDKAPRGAEDEDAGAPAAEADAASPASSIAIDAAAAPVDAGGDDARATAPDAAAPVDAGPPKPTTKQLAQSIVNRKCAPCHTTGMKGGLRLTDVSKPGKRGVLVPGNLSSSSLYSRLVLPKDDDDHMPPEEKTQLTSGEIAILRAFVLEQK